MGYAGYFSTTARLKDKPTELEGVLKSVAAEDSYDVLEKLNYNTAVQPAEQKYRKIKLSNAKISATIAEVSGAREAMSALGWEYAENETDGEVLILPPKTTITMQQVRYIQEAKAAFQKKQKDLKRSASTASLKSDDPVKQRLREQLEADKAERAGMGPVTVGSKAQALPNGGLATADDLGINGGGCC